MRPPPSLTRAYQFPLTTGISLLAIAVTAAWASHYDISPLFADPLYLLSQPCRLVTSALPHGSIFHIAADDVGDWDVLEIDLPRRARGIAVQERCGVSDPDE